MRETLEILLMIMLFYCLLLYLKDENRKPRNLLFFSILYSMLIHTDPRYLFYLLFFIIVFIAYGSFWLGVKKYLLFISITIILLIPWSIRNYVTYNDFILITSHTAEYIRCSNLNKIFKGSDANSLKIVNEDYPTEEERNLVKQGLNLKERSAYEIDAIMHDVYPTSSPLKSMLFWLVEFWRPIRFTCSYSPYPYALFLGKWSLRHNLASLLCYGVLLPFMILGIFYLIKKDKFMCIFLTFPILIHSLLHSLAGATYRYRIPVDAFIIIIAFFGFYGCFFQIKESNNRSKE